MLIPGLLSPLEESIYEILSFGFFLARVPLGRWVGVVPSGTGVGFPVNEVIAAEVSGPVIAENELGLIIVVRVAHSEWQNRIVEG